MNALLADFVERVTRAARNVSVSFARREDLESREFRGGKGEPALQAALLPDEVVGATLGRTPVLFATLPDTYNNQLVAETVRGLRNQSVIARSYLRTEQVVDLQLWLSGPAASLEDPSWRSLAVVIERDDRVARKLVWLRSLDIQQWGASFESFIARTFLARPWKSAPQQPHAKLDRLSALLSVASEVGVDPAVLRRWFDVAESTEDYESGADLVDQLIAAWKGPSA